MFWSFLRFKRWIAVSSGRAYNKKSLECGLSKDEWRDENSLLHRDDGPAAIMHTGDEKWFQHGKLHRDNGPAKISRRSLPGWYVEKWFQYGQVHRDDGPAVVMTDGTTKWYSHGHLHREDGPAIERASGVNEWWVRGRLHRDDGPAIESDHESQWYLKGRLHRVGGPAVSYSFKADEANRRYYYSPNIPHVRGINEWWNKGELHRVDGPALEREDGTQKWYLRGRLHRNNGPAVTHPNGSREWWQNDRLHREDGPAIEVALGHCLLYKKSDNSAQRYFQQKIIQSSVEVAMEELQQHHQNYGRHEQQEWWVLGKKYTEQEFLDWQRKEAIFRKSRNQK